MSNEVDIIPTQDSVVDDKGKMRLSWILFMQNLLVGDQGNKFTPNFSNLTVSGTPTITGVYYQNQGFTDFYVTVVPATSTTSTAGTTYITLPFAVLYDAPCFAITGANAAAGAVNAASNRCYTPAWSAITSPITISGRAATQ